ncbi:hypothetical protein ES703_45103 [subsurface metagenome]
MSWLEHLFEEFSVLPAYLLWQKFIGKENKDKKPENSEDEN